MIFSTEFDEIFQRSVNANITENIPQNRHTRNIAQHFFYEATIILIPKLHKDSQKRITDNFPL